MGSILYFREKSIPLLHLKQIVSIGLLCLLLFNTMGYHIFFLHQQREARGQLRASLDNQVNDSHTLFSNGECNSTKNWIVFRIPIGLYHQPDKTPVAVEGEFEHQGKIYEKALMGIKNDTVLLYCVNNIQQEKVKQSLSDHAKSLAMDYSAHHSGKAQKIIKPFAAEYLPVTNLSLSFCTGICVKSEGRTFSSSFMAVYPDTVYPPPRQA